MKDNRRHLKSWRIFLTALAILYSGWWIINRYTQPEAVDPLLPRLIISAYCALCVIATFSVRLSTSQIFIVYCTAMWATTGHYFWLVDHNPGLPIFTSGVGIASFLIGLTFPSFRSLLLYSCYAVLLACVVAFTGSSPWPWREAVSFVSSVTSMQLCAWIIMSARARDIVALERSESRSRALLKAIPDIIFRFDREFRFVDFHARSDDALLVPPSHFIGKKVSEVLPPELAALSEQKIQKALESGMIQTYEYSAPVNNEVRRYEALISPAGPDEALGIIRDVTEKKLMEERLQFSDRMAAIGTLAAGIAHEINNPLTYVITHLEQLANSAQALTPETKRIIEEALLGVDRVRRIVSDLRIFSRPQELALGPVSVSKVVASSANMASNEFRHKANLKIEVQEDVLVQAIESRMGQVILNLLINAAHSIEEGAPERNEIRIKAKRVSSSVVIEMSDTGCGIAPEHVKKIFDPFFTTKPVGVGTGLGLFLCHNIVQSFGGELTATSEVGKGTTFFIVLPASSQQEPAIPTPKPETPHTHKRGKILIIDDDPILASSVQSLLQTQHDVHTSGSAFEALSLIESGSSFDLILCDLMMPGMSGVDFFSQIQTRFPSLERRILFMTGGTFRPKEDQFLKQFPGRCIEKPFDTKALFATIQKHLAIPQ